MGNCVEIYTDGACKCNPGAGGWGAILKYGEKELEIFGGEPDTTNNRMELTAVIRAVSTLTRPCSVILTTDSEYVMKGVTEWMQSWKANGWKTAAKKSVKNKDLWVSLDSLCKTHDISWRWVKGHSGDEYNTRADKLANKGVYSV